MAERLPARGKGGKPGAPARVKTPHFLHLGWTKLERLAATLQLQRDVLFADLDIVWFRDPMPALLRSRADVQVSSGVQD